MKKKPQRKFSEAVKRRTVADIKAGKMTVREANERLKINSSSLIYTWIRKHGKGAKGSGRKTSGKSSRTTGRGSAPKTPRKTAGNVQHDVVVYLEQASTDITDRLKTGELRRPDRAHALLLLALDTLSRS